jgi:hypothetical protein
MSEFVTATRAQMERHLACEDISASAADNRNDDGSDTAQGDEGSTLLSTRESRQSYQSSSDSSSSSSTAAAAAVVSADRVVAMREYFQHKVARLTVDHQNAAHELRYCTAQCLLRSE